VLLKEKGWRRDWIGESYSQLCHEMELEEKADDLGWSTQYRSSILHLSKGLGSYVLLSNLRRSQRSSNMPRD
jgi:hypothetical protein